MRARGSSKDVNALSFQTHTFKLANSLKYKLIDSKQELYYTENPTWRERTGGFIPTYQTV